MRVKQKAYCFGVVFVYTITAITSPSAGRPTDPSVQTAENNDDDLTTKSLPSKREARKRQQLSSKPGGRGGYSGGRPEHRMRTESSSLEGRLSSPPPKGNCSTGQIKHVVHGRFYISGQLEPNVLNQDYQSDSAASGQAQAGQLGVRGQRLSSAEESWQKLQPVVECGDDGMTLTVRRRRAVQLQLDRVNESSVPLSQLPPECGYSVQKSWRDLSVMARYDACHVTQEGETYVLPLLWRGTPARMSCPVSETEPQALGPPSLCCSPDGMTIKLQEPSASEEQRIAVRGEWTPLTQLVEQCGYMLDRRDAQTVIAAPFVTCGITVKDGKHTLSLQLGENVFTLGCPVSPSEEQLVTHQPLVGSPVETLEPLLWPPPLYLAPPNHPHPTYHHSYVTPKGSSPEPTVTLQPLPPVVSQPDYQDQHSHQIPEREQMYPDKTPHQQTPLIDLSERHAAAPTGFPAQAEPTQFKPLSQDFSPYYHYYHHPKIPLPGTHHDPDPGPDVAGELSGINNPDLTANVQQSQFSALHPHTILTPAHPVLPSPLHSYYPYFYYFPHVVQGETKKQDLLPPDEVSNSDLSSLHKHPQSPVPSVRSMNPNFNEPNPDINSEDFLSDAVKSELDDDKRRSSSETAPLPEQPTPPFIYKAHPYQNYYQPYYDSYHYGDDKQASPAQHHPPVPPTESMYEIQNGLPNYHHHHLYQPTGSEETAASDPQLPSGGEQESAHGAKTGYPSMPLLDFYPYYFSHQHLYDPFKREDDKLDAETKVSDCVLGLPVQSSEDSSEPCMLQQLTSDVDIFIVPVDGCGINDDLFHQAAVHALEFEDIQPQQDDESAHEGAPAGSMVGCSSSTDSPDQMDQPPDPQIHPTPVTLHLKIATDESFSSFHPESHLPLSLVQGRALYMEVSLLHPPEPDLLLLVHSCWAYTHTPYVSWTLVYDGCLSQSVLQLLPSSNSHLIRRIRVSSFLSLPPQSSPYTAPLEDPEIYFLCLADVCSAADNDCVLSCRGPNSDV